MAKNRSRELDDEDDDEPRPRKKVRREEDDEDEPRPVKKRPRPVDEDDDEDDRPRRKSRRDDDEDEDDERPRAKKKRAKSSSKGLIIGLSIGGGVLAIGVVVLLIVLLGGGGGGGADAIVSEYISINNELADILNTVKDQNSAQAAAPRMEQVADKLTALAARARAINLSPEERARVFANSGPQIQQSLKRMQAASVTAVMSSRGAQPYMMATSKLLAAQLQVSQTFLGGMGGM